MNIKVYTALMYVPKELHRTLFGLSFRRRGYMTLSAQVLIGWRIKKPCVIAFEGKQPIGWMICDPVDKGKQHIYVAKDFRHKGIARRMAVALKRAYPHLRMGVYSVNAAKVIRGLAKPRHTY